MASFGGVNLGNAGAAVFELAAASDDQLFTNVNPDGSIVIIPAGSRFVVVQESTGSTFDDVQAGAREAVNRALDIYFGQGGPPLGIGHKDSTYIVSWPTPAGITLRIVGRNQISTRFSVQGEVRDADGNLLKDQPTPTIWHECMRYYRVSESSTDLFDSFRNLYLAIEALLSTIVPPVIKASGRAEGDSEWLARALRLVGVSVDLSPFAPRGSPKTAPNAIHEELYANLRTAIFHAKTGRLTWMPQQWSARQEIVSSRFRYAQMFRRLLEHYYDVKYRSGGLVRSFFESIWEAVLASHDVFVSNDPTKLEDEPAGQYAVAPAGGQSLTLPTRPAKEMDAEWCRGVIGVETPEVIQSAVKEVLRIGTIQEGEVAIVERLAAPLRVDGLAAVQVALLIEGRNYGQPRKDFES